MVGMGEDTAVSLWGGASAISVEKKFLLAFLGDLQEQNFLFANADQNWTRTAAGQQRKSKIGCAVLMVTLTGHQLI